MAASVAIFDSSGDYWSRFPSVPLRCTLGFILVAAVGGSKQLSRKVNQ
ncbi:MAG: hypothetical protein M3430_08840 [Acidobacteriota bacterium]|nr:hypothetical protein [Acidobacteriota bacterium]